MHSTDTLDALKAALGQPGGAILTNPLIKAYSQSTGLVAYDLQAPSLKLYPVLTPIRNIIPRVGGAVGTATHWKAVTAINPGKVSAGVSEGNRGGVIDQTTADYVASFKGLGHENWVSFEADYAGKGFEDVKATAALQTLQATMISEESTIFAGNTSMNLGTTPTPTVTGAITGGALAAATYSVICVALTHAGYGRASVGATGVIASVTRTNADGSTDTFGGGAAQKSANATAAVASGSAGTITATVTPVLGAVAYAWYFGAAGSEKIAQITTINSAVFTASPAGGNQAASALPSSDNSTNALAFDGLLTIASQSTIFGVANGAYQVSFPTGTAGTGTGFTADGAGGISQLTTAFTYFWDNSRLGPDTIWMSAQELINATACIIKNGGVPLVRYVDQAGNRSGEFRAGAVLDAVLNPITQDWVSLRVHPSATKGTLLFSRMGPIPYPVNGIGNVMQMRMRQDYYQLEWPVTKRRYEYGVYCDGVLQHYAPFTLGVMNNVGNTFT